MTGDMSGENFLGMMLSFPLAWSVPVNVPLTENSGSSPEGRSNIRIVLESDQADSYYMRDNQTDLLLSEPSLILTR